MACFFLFLFFLILPSYGSNLFEHPLSSSSFTEPKESFSEFTFKIRNPYNSSTLPFRLWLSSNLSWFEPITFNYSVQPDGFETNGSPYWDFPPLFPNESMEISFNLNKRVGRPEKIEVRTESIDKWSQSCELSILSNDSNGATFPNGTKIYYSKVINSSRVFLVHLEEYNTFAVFVDSLQLNTTYLSSDLFVIENVVSSYANLSASKVVSPKINPTLFLKSVIQGNQSKNESEYDCLALTGMDRYPCTDRESCRYACTSVKVCSYVAQGWDFIDTIYDYNQTRISVNSQIDKSFDDASIFASKPSYDNAKKALDSLVELNTAETELIYHGIFTSYGFCFPPDYSLPSQIEAKRQLLTYLDSYCVYEEENRIVNESLAAGSKLSSLINNKPIFVSAANSSTKPNANVSDNSLNTQNNIPKENQENDNLNETSENKSAVNSSTLFSEFDSSLWLGIVAILILIVFLFSILIHLIVKKT